MKRRLMAAAVTLSAAGAVALAAPTAASATTPIHPHVSAALAKTVIHSGTKTTVSGSVSPNAAGRLVVLQRYRSGAWHTVSSQHKLSSTSRYSFTVGPTTRGVDPYRVYRYAQPGRTSALSRTVRLTVQTYGSITLRSYSGQGDWQGPRIRIPTRDYKLSYHYSCADNFLPFLLVSWNPDGGYESLWSEPSKGGYGKSGTWYGHSGAQSGYFDIGTQGDCNWSFQVTYNGWH